MVERRLHGIGVSPGIAAGPVIRLAAAPPLPDPRPVTIPEAEQYRATAALAAVAGQLNAAAKRIGGGAAADILHAQTLMVNDPLLLRQIRETISNGRDAVHAISDALAVHREAFAATGGMLAERVTDLDDLRDRAIAACLGLPPPGVPDPGHPFILAATDLAPADTAALDASRVLALVTAAGGPTSHTAILARAAGIPAVAGCPGINDIGDGTLISVDGSSGVVESGLIPAQVDAARARERRRRARLSAITGPGRTADGHPIALLANIGAAADLPGDGDCEGVGLFRTELLYLDRTTAPDLETQVKAYRAVFDALGDRPIVVRTLDAGADKPLPFLRQPTEPNPALGVRGLRLGRRDPDLVDTQLTAITRAATDTGARVRVMAPMVSTVSETVDFAARARAAGLTEVGVMIEVPAAALMAPEILSVVDFLSIGTNDLSQYTFAADRQSGELADLLDHRQPALLRLIQWCAEAATVAGKPVGVCGEAAADPEVALILAGLGVTSLSMSANALPGVRQTLSRHTMAQCRELAAEATGHVVRQA